MRSLHSVAVICLCWAVGASVPPSVQAQTAAAFQQARQRMVDEDVAGAGVKNERVLRSMRETPRHEFVPLPHRKNAYFDMALPIGEGQTISSPFIVAYMTEALDPQPTDRVLEIGTGSGYQAAVLSPLVAEVYTIEIVPQLGQNAARTLKRLGYRNVFTRIGDGFLGWPEHAPFDKIIVTCSPEDVPQPLVDQLKEGGRMVIPVGQRYQQTLYVLKKSQGSLQREALQPTLFVPMTGAAEAKRQVQPDPASPSLVNGNFEESFGDPPMPAGWYYLRQARLADEDAAEGKNCLVFENSTPGRGSHALQGLAIDGRKVAAVEVSLRVRARNVLPEPGSRQWPSLVVTFYDEQRATLGQGAVGPWQGTFPWERRTARIEVPPKAREAIVRIGLFGCTGELAYDDLSLRPIAKR